MAGQMRVPHSLELSMVVDSQNLMRDIADKQKLIDRLEHEIDVRNDAMKRLGQEVLNMRKMSQVVKDETNSLKSQIGLYNDRGILEARQVFEVTRERLIVAHVTLLQQYRLYSQRNKENLERIQRLQNHLIKKNENELQIARLKTAHTAQNEFMVSLEAKAAKGKLHRCSVKRMDKAVRILEGLLDQHEHGQSSTSIETIQNPAVRLLEAENKALEEHLQGLEAHAPKAGTHTADVSYLHAENLEALSARLGSLKMKHARLNEENDNLMSTQNIALRKGGLEQVSTLQSQALELEAELLDLTRRQAVELSDVQLKAWESQSVAAGGFGGAASMILNEFSQPRAHEVPQLGETIGNVTLMEATIRNPSPDFKPPRLDPLS